MTDSTTSPASGFAARYAVLLDLGRMLSGTRRPDDLYRELYEQTSRVLETAGFYVATYDADTDTASVVFNAEQGTVDRPNVWFRGSGTAAIREGRPTLDRGETVDEALLRLGRGRTGAAIAAPMLRSNRILGIIGAQSPRADAYDDDDLDLLATVADVAAVALENVRYVQEAERRHRESARLEEIGRALSSSLELGPVLERVVTAALDLAEGDGAAVWLFDHAGRTEIAATAGPHSIPRGMVFPLPGALRHRIVDHRESLVLSNLQSHPLLPPELRHIVHTVSGILVPLVAEDRVIGALSIGHLQVRSYRDEDVRLLERLSYQAAIAVANARLHEQIRMLSLTDPLTGLANRRRLTMFLEKEFAAARRGRDVTVVIFDLDHFKRYNDSAGHQAGDAALIAFARLLARETRMMNLSARFGGDEFVSVLADADHEGGITHARRVASLTAADPLLGPAGLQASAGVASYDPAMADADDLIRAADRDLYRNKAARANNSAHA